MKNHVNINNVYDLVKNIFRKALGAGLAFTVALMTLGIPMHSSAEEFSFGQINDGPYCGVGHLHLMSDGNVFDPNYYQWAHPEVAAGFGWNPEGLYQHYLTVGKSAGWLPYTISYENVPTPVPMQGYWAEKQLLAFSALINDGFILENAKLIGPDRGMLVIHCANSGGLYQTMLDSKVYVDESALFDAGYYAMMNPDVAAIYGTDKAALWNHYKTVGVYEGRPVAGLTDEVNAKIMATQVAASIITPDMSDVQKVIAVHDWMIGYARYDLDCGKHSDDIEGFMFNKSGVCSGYSVTFEYFMKLLDIPCLVVLGDAGGAHAWNTVFVDGMWLYVDVTQDDPVMFKGGFSMYFNGLKYVVNANGPRIDHYNKIYLLKTEDLMWNHTIWRMEDYF